MPTMLAEHAQEVRSGLLTSHSRSSHSFLSWEYDGSSAAAEDAVQRARTGCVDGLRRSAGSRGGLAHVQGLVSLFHTADDGPTVGWQFQEDTLRLVVIVDEPELLGKGKQLAAARSVGVEHKHLEEVFQHILGGPPVELVWCLGSSGPETGTTSPRTSSTADGR